LDPALCPAPSSSTVFISHSYGNECTRKDLTFSGLLICAMMQFGFQVLLLLGKYYHFHSVCLDGSFFLALFEFPVIIMFC